MQQSKDVPTQNQEETLAFRMRKARDDKKLSRRQVSEETGISHNSIEKYENGKQEPNITRIKVLAELYDVSVNWLIGIEKDTLSPTLRSVYVEEDETVTAENHIAPQTEEATSPSLRNVYEEETLSVNVSEEETVAATLHETLEEIDNLRDGDFEDGKRIVLKLINIAHEFLEELEPQELEDLAIERNLFCEQPDTGFGFWELFQDNPEAADTIFKGNIAERIIDTAVLGIDLFKIERDELAALADQLKENHEIEEPAALGFSWGNHEQLVPIIRPILRNLSILNEGYELVNPDKFTQR
ncbi:MAG: helix-turn-helix domain-containing protein [Terasakiella sp.]|uniref:helix-turn-helix domain-containing protein n=1 Tax=unclassified Terasakiella TaxID=2614952 RepID=UPI003B00D1DA